MSFDEQIASLDVGLFGAVPTATTTGDQRSLLRLQRCVRDLGSYVYLEIGSHFGGTLQQHLLDGRCRLIYSIDKRPLVLPDELRGSADYPGNSTERMLAGLRNAFPQISLNKLKTFDCDASEIDERQIPEKANFCFIDAEHTNRAVCSDFDFCLRICELDGIIALHDANVIYGGLEKIKRTLGSSVWTGYVLPDSVYSPRRHKEHSGGCFGTHATGQVYKIRNQDLQILSEKPR
ncbi:MAG TPA: class I SAM-dependent methyltransferase [Chthoniobacterales bacterium]